MENSLSSWKIALPAATRFATCRTGIGSFLVCCLASILLHGRAAAQCNNSNNLSVRTYDTVITSPGYGTFRLNFPKWSPDSGLLVSVKVSAVVNLQYSFSLKNTDFRTGTYNILVGREDYFASTAMSAAYDKINEKKIGTYTLHPGEQVVQTPFAFLNNYINADSIAGNTAPFLGSGSVSFTYSPITYTNISTSNNVSYGYQAKAAEVTHFTLSYVYCTGAGVLARDLTFFRASLAGPSSAQLSWSTATEQKDRVYEIQRSRDGQSFTTIGSRAAEAPSEVGPVNYSYVDRLDGSGKWYYRLRLVSTSGISYSPVQLVTAPSDGGDRLVVFPNPAVDHINLLVPGDPAAPGDWLVNIRAVDGRLVQSARFSHSNNLPLFFHQTLSPGVYFVTVTDLQGRGGRVASFRVDPR